MKWDFLGVNDFHSEFGNEVFSTSELEEQKVEFVRSWFMENGSTVPDDDQLAAIASVDKNLQLVARAGSGKTTTVVHRALFLIKHCGVQPNEILILAFNRKAAREVRIRILSLLGEWIDDEIEECIGELNSTGGEREDEAIDDLAYKYEIELPFVMTFHALGYAIAPPNESLSEEGGEMEVNQSLSKVIDAKFQGSEARALIKKIMLCHFREDRSRVFHDFRESFKGGARYCSSLPWESMKGEKVKTPGEKVIADYLFEHGIEYKYQRNFNWSGVNYRPDFTLTNSNLAIELFGDSGDENFDNMYRSKRAFWSAQTDWALIEFHSDEFDYDDPESIRSVIRGKLEANGVFNSRQSEDSVWQLIGERAERRFKSAMFSFFEKCRQQRLSPSDLQNLVESHDAVSSVEEWFLQIASNLFIDLSEDDAGDVGRGFYNMLEKAIEAIDGGQTSFRRSSGSGNLNNLRYLFVDEFQDFSELFYGLVKAIREQNEDLNLFCVGDDWQAINGYAGSDLSYFENFSECFGESRKLYLATNYRSASSIVEAGNSLMEGLGKPAKSFKEDEGDILVSYLDDFKPSVPEKGRHGYDLITPALLRLIPPALAEGLDVVLLCRTNYVPWSVNSDKKDLHGFLSHVRSFLPEEVKDRVSVSTSHKYKGLEKSMVVVLDAKAKSYPLIHSDAVFNRVLGDSPEKTIEEDRRLFHVAMTRAEEKLVIFTDGRETSPFLEDLTD
ncbi:MAG: DEAD/DEAH box helicase, partial [Opitutae bacterium]|nr:DEAD/DEAH box helicase [Opitutae bacterium]